MELVVGVVLGVLAGAAMSWAVLRRSHSPTAAPPPGDPVVARHQRLGDGPRLGWGAGVHLGTVSTGDVVNGNRTFTTSTMSMGGTTVTVTLGGSSGGTKAAANTTLSWTPSTLATDLAGNAMSATAVNESGGLDTDF
jgi:hypothetical protein